MALATRVAEVGPVTARRQSTVADRGRNLQLEAIRGAAALAVVTVHAGFMSGAENVFSAQDSGLHLLLRRSLTDSVVLFFALSGYLVGGPFLRSLLSGDRPADPVTYTVRRAARILPGYWVALAAMLALLAVAGPGFALWQVPVHAFLLQNLVPGPESTALLGVAWTLGIEAAFYVVLPLTVYAVRRLHRGPVRAGSVIGAILAVWVLAAGLGLAVDLKMPTSPWWYPINLNLPFCICLFCPGMVLAVIEARPPRGRGLFIRAGRWIANHPTALALPAFLCLFVSARLMVETTEWVTRLHYQFAALGCGFVVALALRARLAHLFPVRLLAEAGKVSYGIYVWHWVVLTALLRLGIAPGRGLAWSVWAKDAGLLIVLTIPLAILSWVVVEKPCQSLARNWTAQRRHRVAHRAPAPLRPASFPGRLRTRLIAAMVMGTVAGSGSALFLARGAATNALAAAPPPRPVIAQIAQATSAPAPDPRPIVAFGDSLTMSWGATPAQSYPAVLQGILGQQVLTAGFEGKTTAQAVALLPQVLALDPRMVVVEFGTNDACLGVPVASALGNIATILNELTSRHIAAVIVGTHYDLTRHNDSPICAHWTPYAQSWDAGLTALAQLHHAGLALNVLQGVPAQVDGYHPLPPDYAMVAQRVAVPVRAVETGRLPSA